jgi:hypothetical protein
MISAVAGKKIFGGTHHYSSRSHIATYCTSWTGSRFLQAVSPAVLLPARNQDSTYGVWLKTVSGGLTQLMNIKPLARCTSRAFLFSDIASFIALNDLSHSDVDTRIESSNVLIFFLVRRTDKIFLLVLSSKVLIFTGTAYRCVPAQLQH